MEKLTRIEKMLIKGQIIEEIRRLESINEKIEKKSNRSNGDMLTYIDNRNSIKQYKVIVDKLSK